MTDTPRLLAFADLALDQSAHVVTRGHRELELTATEYRLLDMFLRHPRQVLTGRQVLAEVWASDAAVSNQVAVHVSSLRRKLEKHGEPRLIHTVRGVGYVLREGP